ncbi:MAG: hypothetical protein U1A77_10885 [Pirellulales bacterium]
MARIWLAYLTTRFGSRVALGLPIALLFGKWLADPNNLDAPIVVDFAIACLYVLAFRIADDMADRKSDCLKEPTRVLCDDSSVRPVLLLGVIASLIATMTVAATRLYPVLLVALATHAYLLGWYAIRDKLKMGRRGNSHFVLAKYPLLVVVLAMRSEPTIGERLVAAAAATYCGLCLFEYWDDRDLREEPSSRYWMAGAALTLICVLMCLLATSSFIR